MPSASGPNPMQQAVFRGCVECIRMLVETPPYYSVDSCCGPDGLRPIHIAAREGHIQTLRFLSAAGACLQRSDYNGATALHHAAVTGQLRAIRWLLRHGAKILLDKRGQSPIQVAASHDYMEIVNVLTKHASSSSSSTLNCKDPSPTSGKSANDTKSETRTSRRSARDSSKDRSDLTTGSVEVDYTISSQNHQKNHLNNKDSLAQNPKPFSHLHNLSDSEGSPSPSKVSSPGDCASSSGNSSLSASTSAPSLSPSASSASCGCSTSDETTLIKSVVEVSDSFTSEDCNSSKNFSNTSGDRGSLPSSPLPFFLHPPKEKSSSPQNKTNPEPCSTESSTDYIDKDKGKKSTHKRQGSTAALTSPFFLHPPENLVSETQKVVLNKMAPGPVNPSHSHHHFADPINEPTPKLKVSHGGTTSPSSSSSSSPPLSPPPQINCFSPVTVSCLNKFQGDSPLKKSHCNNKSNNDSASNNHEVNVRNHINNSSIGFAPPPPPPPLPNSDGQKALPAIPNGHQKKADERHIGKNDVIVDGENDYEDIEELTNGANKNHYEQARKLLRSVSAPTPAMTDCTLNNGQNNEDKPSSPPAVPEKVPVLSKPPMGCGKPGVPFIPPHFPTPPHDALIKPSEYLRSIQNKTKLNGTNGSNANGGHISRPSSRVEEALKALGVQDSHLGLMSPVPEETNAEDEFEEINPERINGFTKYDVNEAVNNEPNYGTTNWTCSNGGDDTNNNKGGGRIKAEELLKVHLRKTPMSRTKSAPPLGRVIPDEQVQDQKIIILPQENSHEPLKRTNTSGSSGSGGSGETGTIKADIIAELAESSQVGGVREWKEELRRRQKEQDKAVQKEIEQFYQPVNFVAEVPSMDVTGAPIPDWKRQMLARKAAERAKKEAEEQRRLEIEAKRMASIPIWRRQLLQRRESDGKYAQ